MRIMALLRVRHSSWMTPHQRVFGKKRRRVRPEFVQEFHGMGCFFRVVQRGPRKFGDRDVLRGIRLVVIDFGGELGAVQDQQVAVADPGIDPK